MQNIILYCIQKIIKTFQASKKACYISCTIFSLILCPCRSLSTVIHLNHFFISYIKKIYTYFRLLVQALIYSAGKLSQNSIRVSFTPDRFYFKQESCNSYLFRHYFIYLLLFLDYFQTIFVVRKRCIVGKAKQIKQSSDFNIKCYEKKSQNYFVRKIKVL